MNLAFATVRAQAHRAIIFWQKSGLWLTKKAWHCVWLQIMLSVPLFATEPQSLVAHLPENTCLVITATNLDRLHANWQKTSYFELIEDPLLSAFRANLAAQSADPFDVKSWLGFSWDDLASISSGKSLLGIVPQAKDCSAILWIKCQDKKKQVDVALAKSAKYFRDLHAQHQTTQVNGTTLDTYILPGEKKFPGGNVRIYFVQDGALGICNDLTLARQVVQLNTQPVKKTLLQGDVDRFETDLGMRLPNITADLNLIFRPAPLDAEPLHGKPPESIDQWFNSLRHLGNKEPEVVRLRIAFGNFKHDVDVWGLSYAPWPHQKALELLTFLPGPSLEPPAWILSNVSAYVNYRWQMDQAIKAYGYVVDEWYGEGEEGVFEDMLNGLLDDPQGPKIDVRRDVIAHLGPEVFYSWNLIRPVGESTQRHYIWAAPEDAYDTVEKTIARYFEGDDQIKLEKTAQLETWQTRVAGRSLFSLGTKKSGSSTSVLAIDSRHLFLANNDVYLVNAISNNQLSPLARSAGYRQVANVLETIQTEQTALRSYFRSDDFVSVRFEAYRQGELSRETDPLSRWLNNWLTGTEQSAQRLPTFDKVRGFFGVGGSTLDIVPEGWGMRAFVMKPQANPSTP